MITAKTKEKIFRIVSSIPRGSVATYKTIAAIARIKNPRLVGRILHTNTNPKSVPCHRVVRSDGTLADGYAFGGKAAQRKKLENEEIKFINSRVPLKKYLWNPVLKSILKH